jgi:hypothetical protein
MLRSLRTDLLVVSLGLLGALGSAAPAAADVVSFGDAACTAAEDPINLRLVDLRISHQRRRGAPVVRLTGAAAARWVANLFFRQPAGAGSSDSYFRFTREICVNQTEWVTNHTAAGGGLHARFWQNGGAWRSVWGAAHRETLCHSGWHVNHKVDNFNDARDIVVATFDLLQMPRHATYWEFRRYRARPASTIRKTCSGGEAVEVADDGMVVEIRQVVFEPFFFGL